MSFLKLNADQRIRHIDHKCALLRFLDDDLSGEFCRVARALYQFSHIIFVFAVLGIKDNICYVIHIERWKAEINESIERLKSLIDIWNVRKIGIEANGPQLGIADMVRKQISGDKIKYLNPQNDKLVRALPFAMKWNKGEVYVVKGNWNRDFVFEIEGFTGDNKEHDDQVDAIVNAYDMNKIGGQSFNMNSLQDRLNK